MHPPRLSITAYPPTQGLGEFVFAPKTKGTRGESYLPKVSTDVNPPQGTPYFGKGSTGTSRAKVTLLTLAFLSSWAKTSSMHLGIMPLEFPAPSPNML